MNNDNLSFEATGQAIRELSEELGRWKQLLPKLTEAIRQSQITKELQTVDGTKFVVVSGPATPSEAYREAKFYAFGKNYFAGVDQAADLSGGSYYFKIKTY